MKIIVDKMPTRPSKCIFSRRTYRDSFVCKFWGTRQCNIESCEFIRPERKAAEGEWINGECNKCGTKALRESYYGVDGEETCTSYSKFCPNCGVKMKNHD